MPKEFSVYLQNPAIMLPPLASVFSFPETHTFRFVDLSPFHLRKLLLGVLMVFLLFRCSGSPPQRRRVCVCWVSLVCLPRLRRPSHAPALGGFPFICSLPSNGVPFCHHGALAPRLSVCPSSRPSGTSRCFLSSVDFCSFCVWPCRVDLCSASLFIGFLWEALRFPSPW